MTEQLITTRHFTVTCYVIFEKKVLLIYHPKFNKWLPPGGHLEPNETPPACAKREVLEETGLEIALIPQENLWVNCWNAASFERPYLCLLENIPPHGNLPVHQHMDLVYVGRPIGGKEHASSLEMGTLRWMDLEEVERLKGDEETFIETQQTIKHIVLAYGR